MIDSVYSTFKGWAGAVLLAVPSAFFVVVTGFAAVSASFDGTLTGAWAHKGTHNANINTAAATRFIWISPGSIIWIDQRLYQIPFRIGNVRMGIFLCGMKGQPKEQRPRDSRGPSITLYWEYYSMSKPPWLKAPDGSTVDWTVRTIEPPLVSTLKGIPETAGTPLPRSRLASPLTLPVSDVTVP